jgi:hypothetical protein
MKKTGSATQTGWKRDVSWLSNTLVVGSEPAKTTMPILDDLIISCTGQGGRPGGLFTLGKGPKPTLRVLDRFDSTGIWLDSQLFVRSVEHAEHMILFLYSPESIWTIATEKYKQVHDVRYQFGQLYVVSTSTNEVVQLDSAGKQLYSWKFPGEGDAWHLNCLDLWNGRYVISCFGKFAKEREFKGQWQGKGLLFDLETEEILWDGLSLPHTPRMDEQGRQYICDSGTHRLLMRNGDGSGGQEFPFPGSFTRGLAFGTSHIYVGLSTLRPSFASDARIPNAQIAILDKNTFKQVGLIDLPTAEVYEILITSD